ncbi:hypothetical protein GH714_034551 [Hevea brasiliensis]|uniref:Uncharacterized protein n=1 Tax=Hevea brasiliensis TaxID=3981 RepID=A0A6A6MJ27_HEVBR|nr:hypothetical protein GH714_034551 [Hevea brasiliensis]
MKAMAARALWHLAKGNSPICRIITESRALLCFAALLEKGAEDVQFNSAMALMEITAVAEKDADLRRSAFKPNSPACKAVIDQLLKIIEKADSNLLIPCIKAIGNLARTFRATETRMIAPLVNLLDEREDEVSREASIALTKFACTENYLHLDHSKAIIQAGGEKHLIQLVYFGDQVVQLSALYLLSCIAMHVPDSEELAKAKVLTVLEWASKQSFTNIMGRTTLKGTRCIMGQIVEYLQRLEAPQEYGYPLDRLEVTWFIEHYWRVPGADYKGGLMALAFDSDVVTMCEHAVEHANVDSNIEIVNDVQCEANISEHGVNEENSDGSVRAKEVNADDGFNEYIDALIGSERLDDYINPIVENNMGNFGNNSQDVPCAEVIFVRVGGIMQ